MNNISLSMSVFDLSNDHIFIRGMHGAKAFFVCTCEYRCHIYTKSRRVRAYELNLCPGQPDYNGSEIW